MKKTNLTNISFEFFPPKTPEGVNHLLQTAKILADYNPDYFSVTFGAGGSTREGTLDTVKMLLKHTPVAATPHISCMGTSKQDILDILVKYQTLGIKHLVALRGDLPSGMGMSGDLRYANELVTFIREQTGDHFHIDVAAYPEIHPQAPSAQQDILNFKRKVEAGANGAITQYFFNVDAYFHFLDECTTHGIFIPIVPGIMPIYQFSKLARFSEVCGAEIPRWIRKRLESYGDDQESVRLFGLEVVYHMCDQLVAGGAPGLHFYTLNQADVVVMLLKHFKQDQAASKAS